MKKVIIIVVVIFVCVIVACGLIWILCPRQKGDINNDGVIDAADCELLRNAILKNKWLPKKAADINGDNTIDIIDYTLLRLAVLEVQPLETD